MPTVEYKLKEPIKTDIDTKSGIEVEQNPCLSTEENPFEAEKSDLELDMMKASLCLHLSAIKKANAEAARRAFYTDDPRTPEQQEEDERIFKILKETRR
jgi:hypothetical protein